MTTKTLLLAFLTGIFLLACNSERVIEKFSEEKPYAIEIARERSLYQAEKLTERLIDMGLDAYLIQHSDSLEADGEWFYVLYGNIEHLDSAVSLKESIEIKHNLQKLDLNIVEFQSFKNATFEIAQLKNEEAKTITTNTPDVGDDVYKVMKMFPESNALYIEKAYVINTPEDPSKRKGFDVLSEFRLDLPRGISRNLMLQNTTAFVEIIYKDNLYDDRVTIDIGKLRNRRPIISNASLITQENKRMFEIAEEYADLILNTGNYTFEEKKEITINSFTNLYGYKVTIETRRNNFRTYLILVDKHEEYILFCQSTDKTEEELIRILSDVGKGNGLLNYNEFYNTFNTIPDNMVDGDIFIGFMLDKIGWSYAEQRGRAQWAREIVGHWSAVGYFYNSKKGNWVYGIFDLLTERNQNYVYGGLYSQDVGENKQPTKVYGTNGFTIYDEQIDWSNWEVYKIVSEVNFGIDRFVCHVNNRENSWFTKEELIKRAEALQFKIKDKEEEKPLV